MQPVRNYTFTYLPVVKCSTCKVAADPRWQVTQEVSHVLQASLSMAVLVEGLLFAFHLQVGSDPGVQCRCLHPRLVACTCRALQYAADSTV